MLINFFFFLNIIKYEIYLYFLNSFFFFFHFIKSFWLNNEVNEFERKTNFAGFSSHFSSHISFNRIKNMGFIFFLKRNK